MEPFTHKRVHEGLDVGKRLGVEQKWTHFSQNESPLAKLLREDEANGPAGPTRIRAEELIRPAASRCVHGSSRACRNGPALVARVFGEPVLQAEAVVERLA
jgi:hypothetical protein